MLRWALVGSVVAVVGCATHAVDPVTPDEADLSHVCIEKNPAVMREDLLPGIRSGFHDAGVTTEVYLVDRPEHCAVWVAYTGRQRWNLLMYLKEADIWLYDQGGQIGSIHYEAGANTDMNASSGEVLAPAIKELLLSQH